MNDIVTTVVGRVTHSPQRRALDSGREVVTFRMACNHRYFDRAAGVWKEGSTSYVSVDVWRRQLGRCVMGSLAKGDPVLAHGRLLVREYEQDGRLRSAVTLMADAIGPDLSHAMAVVTRIRRADGVGGEAAAGGTEIDDRVEDAVEQGGATAIEVPALLDEETDRRRRRGLAVVGTGDAAAPGAVGPAGAEPGGAGA